MLDMAKVPRRLKVMQAVGEWRQPTSGMLPGCPGATFVMSLLLERWRRGTGAASPTTRVRCWVDGSTASGKGCTDGLGTLVAAVLCMEDLEQGDGLRANRKKSGAEVSHPRLLRLVEVAAEVRRRAPQGLVVGCGELEPLGWEALWRQLLQADAGTRFEWHGCRNPEVDLRAVASATSVWISFDNLPPDDDVGEVLRANRGV